jgi:vacuolar-type H+-ATPase subunit I/STV1
MLKGIDMTPDTTTTPKETPQESVQRLCREIKELTLKREIYNNVIDMVIQFSQDKADTDQKMLILHDIALDFHEKLNSIENNLIIAKFVRGRMINQHGESIKNESGI